ncbi:MAG: hypothetical protein ACR2P3_03685 [Geminicoccaceae bacterium]
MRRRKAESFDDLKEGTVICPIGRPREKMVVIFCDNGLAIAVATEFIRFPETFEIIKEAG